MEQITRPGSTTSTWRPWRMKVSKNLKGIESIVEAFSTLFFSKYLFTPSKSILFPRFHSLPRPCFVCFYYLLHGRWTRNLSLLFGTTYILIQNHFFMCTSFINGILFSIKLVFFFLFWFFWFRHFSNLNFYNLFF